GQHRDLYSGQDLTGVGADHREAEDPVVTLTDDRLHEAVALVGRLRPQHRGRRQLRHARGHALASRVALAAPDVGGGRIREHDVGDQPSARGAIASGQVVQNDPEVVDGHVRELRAAGAFSDGPDPGRGGLEPLVDPHVPAVVQLDADLLEADPGGVGGAPGRDEQVAPLDRFLSGRTTYRKHDLFAGSPVNLERLGRHHDLDAFGAEDPLDLVRDVAILAGHELRPLLDDRHAAAEAAVGLRQLQTDIASSEHDQMRRQVIELQRLDVRERAHRLEARNARNGGVRADVDEPVVTGHASRPAVVHLHLERPRGYEAARAHDQLGAALLVVAQVRGDQSVDHVALASAHRRHVDRDGTGHRAEVCGVAHQMRHFRAPDLA